MIKLKMLKIGQQVDPQSEKKNRSLLKMVTLNSLKIIMKIKVRNIQVLLHQQKYLVPPQGCLTTPPPLASLARMKAVVTLHTKHQPAWQNLN